MALSAEDIEMIFTYQPPTPKQLEHYDAIRRAAKSFALVLVANTPASADQTAAIRKLREVVATANASIALQGKF
jgi:hypothetical protein